MSITFELSTHGHLLSIPLKSAEMWTVERLNELYRKNLLRLWKESGLKKYQFADRLGIGPDHFSQLISETKKTPIGKETMINICNVFNVSPKYFDQEETEPQPLTIREEQAVYKMREAERMGKQVAEQLELTIDAVVTAAKKRTQTPEELDRKIADSMKILKQRHAAKKKRSA